MRVLVVEDEQRLARLIRRGLLEEGCAVDLAMLGEEALEWVQFAAFDAILLDVMLPDLDGFSVCKALRARGIQTPILMLTARDAVEDRVAGLDAGADDYLTKPFAFAELKARLRALVRRSPETVPPVLSVADVRLDPAAHRAWRGDEELSLPNKEFRLLEFLMRHADRVVTRSMIADHIWDYEFLNTTNVIDVHIRSLRRKLDDPFAIKRIVTVRGAGYKLRSDDD